MRLAIVPTLVLVFLGGCAGCSPGLRGDGTLAVLELSDKLHQLRYDASTITMTAGGNVTVQHEVAGDMVDAFCAGARLWDVVGAQVRCAREVEGQHAASSVGVVLAESWEYPGQAAWWNPMDGKIHVATMQWVTADGAAAAAAHEIGHALGLEHLGPGNLMTADIEADAPTATDQAAFAAIWQRR